MDSPDAEPWVSFNKNTGVLSGNSEGFRCFRDSINLLISGGVKSVDVEGEEIEICSLVVAERLEEIPKPPLGSIWNLILFLCLLTLLFVFAGIGIVASVNWLTSR
ncbi:MAG: hypothetical protein ABIT37_00470 [Luteolibacter sp.]